MVLFVMAEGLVREAVVRDALDFELVRVARRRSDGVGPVWDTGGLLDVALLDVRVERPGRAVPVRKAVARDALARGYRGRRGADAPGRANRDAARARGTTMPFD